MKYLNINNLDMLLGAAKKFHKKVTFPEPVKS
jgi:hypothetical protein